MLSSAAQFVECGLQDPYEDACSICLEAFSAADPASITDCNHPYHLQCILEWVQRSSDCPMCWQPLVIKDAAGQELLSSVEQERSLCSSQIQASYVPFFQSEDHDIDHFVSFEEQLMQHLAATTAGQAQSRGRQEHFLLRPTSAGLHPHHFNFFRPNPSAVCGFDDLDSSASDLNVASSGHLELGEQSRSSTLEGQSVNGDNRSGNAVNGISSNSASATEVPASRSGNATQGASTSVCQSFSEAVRSRFAAVSSKYKDVFTKTTRMFREKMRSTDTRGIRSRDVSTGVMQALGQISLESAGQKDMDASARAHSLAKQAHITDKKRIGGGSLDGGKSPMSMSR